MVGLDFAGLDPFSAALGRAVKSVLGRVFLVLLVPAHLELQIEEIVDMFEGNVIRGTAFGWHMCWVRDGHGEDTLQA